MKALFLPLFLKSATKSILGDSFGVHGLAMPMGVFALWERANRRNDFVVLELSRDNSTSVVVSNLFVLEPCSLAIRGEFTLLPLGVFGGMPVRLVGDFMVHNLKVYQSECLNLQIFSPGKLQLT